MGKDELTTSNSGQENSNEIPAESLALPAAEVAYLAEIVNQLKNYLGERLAGVYLFGSAGYGAYEPGLSDLDVEALVGEPLSPEAKLEIARRLSQENLPCPANKLEFVC